MIIDFENDGKSGGGGGGSAIKVETRKNITVTKNGVVEINPSFGYDGIEGATITTNLTKLDKIKIVDYWPITFCRTNTYSIPQYADLTGLKEANYLFSNCGLNTCEGIDLSDAKDLTGTFSENSSLQSLAGLVLGQPAVMTFCFQETNIESVPMFDMSKCYNLFYCFHQCFHLKTFEGDWDTSNVNNFEHCFSECHELKIAPNFNTKSATSLVSMFSGCRALTTVGELDCGNLEKTSWSNGISYIFSYCESLTTLGGFKDLKMTVFLSDSPNLTKESLMNVINKLGQADPTIEETPALVLANASYALLTPEDIAIATGKGWHINA